MGRWSLQHTSDVQVHTSRALPARCVPPSGFGHPLDGFRPARPSRLCFAPAALMGFTLRSVLLPLRYRARFRADAPTCRFSRRYFRRRRDGGPVQRDAASGFSPAAGVPGDGRQVRPRGAGCSHGFRPPEVFRTTPRPRPSPGLLPRAFARHASEETRRPAPRSVNRTSPGPAHASRSRRGRHNLYRVRAPSHSRTFGLHCASGGQAAPRRVVRCRRSAGARGAHHSTLPEPYGSAGGAHRLRPHCRTLSYSSACCLR